MKRLFVPVLLLLAAAGDASSIQIDHPWARASARGATTGAAYVTLTEQGQPDQLVGVSTPVAATAQVHEVINDAGIMKMRPVARIPLEPGKPVTLAPGGLHIMLTGLKAPLQQGTTFPLTLTFQHAAPVTVRVTVETLGGMGGHPSH